MAKEQIVVNNDQTITVVEEDNAPTNLIDDAISSTISNDVQGETIDVYQRCAKSVTEIIYPDAAEANIIETIAGENIGGNRAVKIVAGESFYVSASELDTGPSLAGLSTHAAVIGQTLVVQVQGTMHEPSWSFTDGKVFLGELGVLTQTPPGDTDNYLVVGEAVSSADIIIKDNQPILRE